jgi:hypothetical protein
MEVHFGLIPDSFHLFVCFDGGKLMLLLDCSSSAVDEISFEQASKLLEQQHRSS